MERQFGATTSGVGATYGWSGKKAGAGTMRIERVEAGRRVELALDFTRPMRASNRVAFTFEPDGDGTRVTWAMTGHNALGARIFGVLVNVDRMVGRDFESGLAGLERVVTT